MSRLLTEDGAFIPVTLVELVPNFVTQIKTVEKDGYNSVQLGINLFKKNNKSLVGKSKIVNTFVNYHREFKIDSTQEMKFTVGDLINFHEIFTLNDQINVTGTSKGKGFQGVIKRHNFSAQGHSHGVTKSHRGLGSTGMCAEPSRVIPGSKMPGQMGNQRTTIKNLSIVYIDEKTRYIAIKGAIPGPKNSIVLIKQIN